MVPSAGRSQLELWKTVTRRLPYLKDYAVAAIKRALPVSVRPWIRERLRRRAQVLSEAFSRSQMTNPQVWDEYHRLVAANVAGVIWKIMARFYGDLDVVPGSIPLVKAVESFHGTLTAVENVTNSARPSPVLIQFERAFLLSEAGRTGEALALFEAVFRNKAARKVAPYDPFVREAVVRSGEFLGRHYDKRGDIEECIAIYREIMSIESDGVVAHRLIVLLCRRGDFSKAAEFGDAAMLFKVNLFPRLPEKNPYIAALQKELSAE